MNCLRFCRNLDDEQRKRARKRKRDLMALFHSINKSFSFNAISIITVIANKKHNTKNFPSTQKQWSNFNYLFLHFCDLIFVCVWVFYKHLTEIRTPFGIVVVCFSLAKRIIYLYLKSAWNKSYRLNWMRYIPKWLDVWKSDLFRQCRSLNKHTHTQTYYIKYFIIYIEIYMSIYNGKSYEFNWTKSRLLQLLTMDFTIRHISQSHWTHAALVWCFLYIRPFHHINNNNKKTVLYCAP